MDRLIGALLVVVLFVPIDRYKLPAVLPFDLELYRIVVATLLLLWFIALLIDSRVRLESTAFDRPVFLIMACTLASEVTNPGRVTQYGSHVIKSLMFFVSFVLLYYLIVATIRRREDLLLLLKILTVGGASIGALAVYEVRTHYNLFDHVQTVLPFLIPQFEGDYHLGIGGNIRAVGSSQHPIALGAALILILPLAIYFARTSGRRWWIAAVLLVLGAFASGSRTAIIMLAIVGIVFLCLKPTETKRLWPALVPAVVVIHFATTRTTRKLLGRVLSHRAGSSPNSRGSRPTTTRFLPVDVFVSSSQCSPKPARSHCSARGWGRGLPASTRPIETPRSSTINGLGSALEVGFVGIAAWVWLFVRAVRRLAQASRTATGMGDDWLFAALAASVASCAVGMLTFDAFDFTQVAFIFWILLAVSAAPLFRRHPRAWLVQHRRRQDGCDRVTRCPLAGCSHRLRGRREPLAAAERPHP